MDEHLTNLEVLRFDRLEEASRVLAARLAETADQAVRRRGRFAMALSGGSTPRGLYSLLAGGFKHKIPWGRTHLFWGDERWVPQADPRSNYRLAYEALVSKIPIPAENVHPPPVGIGPPAKGAVAYEQALRLFFGEGERGGALETFDVILLGAGADGHTASLFPGSRALEESQRWVRSVLAPVEFSPRKRITLTLPAINKARQVYFLVAGPDKARVVKSLMERPEEARRRFPAAMVRPRIKATWLVASRG